MTEDDTFCRLKRTSFNQARDWWTNTMPRSSRISDLEKVTGWTVKEYAAEYWRRVEVDTANNKNTT